LTLSIAKGEKECEKGANNRSQKTWVISMLGVSEVQRKGTARKESSTDRRERRHLKTDPTSGRETKNTSKQQKRT